MTKEEFEVAWAREAGLKTTALDALGYQAEPCNCGEDGCEGWVMTGGPLSRAFALPTEVKLD